MGHDSGTGEDPTNLQKEDTATDLWASAMEIIKLKENFGNYKIGQIRSLSRQIKPFMMT